MQEDSVLAVEGAHLALWDSGDKHVGVKVHPQGGCETVDGIHIRIVIRETWAGGKQASLTQPLRVPRQKNIHGQY